MATRVVFDHVKQDAPAFGSTETRAVSRVFFNLEIDGEIHQDLHVDLEEAVGSTHQGEEMTVGKLEGVAVDHEALAGAVRSYYWRLVNSAGYGKHLAKDKGFRMQGDELGLVQVVEL